ncbi:MAG TPA: ABC transporter permease [Pyrinomonadaceae bacterium]|nr:ABC transporter permease [Pyrinomonadaceae bacterium]
MLSTQTAHRRIWQPLWQLPSRAELIFSFAKRELLGRYKGSALGIAWAVLTPVVMIAIFTFIFAGIFGARFGVNHSHWDYALYLFCGLLPWSMFQESVQQSSNTIVANSNLVKRVVFPLEALPAAQVFAALGNQLFATAALLIATIIVRQRLELTAIWLPVLLIPQILFSLGASWLIASLGVFLRDIAQGITLLLMAWLYLTPIIYPESIVPEHFRTFIELNPFTALVRNYRLIFLDGLPPDWRGLAYFTTFAAVVFIFGYWWFARTRKSFADVV